ncbi:MAG: hypothetical protein GXX96_05980 [Planctomycetaceae bacterium]|nr:hypothetical protein [Planctomycetaceae bacterium]
MKTIGSIIATALVLGLAVWRWYAARDEKRERDEKERNEAIHQAAHSDDDSDVSGILRP